MPSKDLAECIAELDAKKRSFLGKYKLREFKWCRRNIRTVLSMGGAERKDVDAVINAVFGSGCNGYLGTVTGRDNVFDHQQCYGRDGRPLFLFGFPYGVRREGLSALAEIGSLGVDVSVDSRGNWYGYGTVTVEVCHWSTIRELLPKTNPISPPQRLKAHRDFSQRGSLV